MPKYIDDTMYLVVYIAGVIALVGMLGMFWLGRQTMKNDCYNKLEWCKERADKKMDAIDWALLNRSLK